MKTVTEISKHKFLEMVEFCKSQNYETLNENMSSKYGEERARLFSMMLTAYNKGDLHLDTFIRVELRDDGFIRFRHFHK